MVRMQSVATFVSIRILYAVAWRLNGLAFYVWDRWGYHWCPLCQEDWTEEHGHAEGCEFQLPFQRRAWKKEVTLVGKGVK